MGVEAKDAQFIVCPVCSGAGKNKLGLACLNCGGMGLGMFSQGNFFYWGPKIGRAMIELGRAKRKFDLALNFAAFGVTIAGIGALAYWLFENSRNTADPYALAFWREQHILLLVFWVSIYAGMFVFYRMSEEARRFGRIIKQSYGEKSAGKIPDNWEELKKMKSTRKIDVAAGIHPRALKTVDRAYLLASKLGHAEAAPLHLFFESLLDVEVAAVFTRLGVNGEKLVGKLKEKLTATAKSKDRTIMGNSLKEALIETYLSARKFGQVKATEKNFVIPCLDKDAFLSEFLYELEVDKDKVNNVISWFIINEKLVANYKLYRKMARFKPGTSMDRAYTAVASPILSHFSHDLTNAAKWGKLDFCVAREEEIENIWQHFESGASGVVLVGPPGVGKNTITGGIAQLMVQENVPKMFKDKRLVELDVARLVSGATASEAQERLLAIIDEISRAGNIVLYVDNIENIMGITSGGEESLDLSEVLTSALERVNFYCLASITNENYAKFLEGKPLGNSLAAVAVSEPVGNQAIQIIESKISRFEAEYKVYFSYTAIEQVIKLSSRYIHDKYLPKKAIDILELVAVKTAKARGDDSFVGEDDIAAAVSEITNIPVTKITEAESKNLLNL